MGELGFQKFAQLRRRLELRDGIQFLECRRERIRETPDRSWSELLVHWPEVKIMHGAGKMLRSLQLRFDERFVDDHLRSDIRQFALLPSFHLLSHLARSCAASGQRQPKCSPRARTTSSVSRARG